MYLKRRSTMKYLLAACAGAALYSEWFTYIIQPWYWPGLSCNARDQSCIKVLFIADPQIQGDLAVPPPARYIYNWDSDRYLRSSFTVVMNHFKPDVLVYLGDLMDEGSVSTMPQFHGYVNRLSKIFETDNPIVQVWLPGDNDIGGENEPIRNEKVLEFDKIFDQPLVINFKNVTFYKVNGITHSYPMKGNENNNLKIIVSHYPLTNRYSLINQIIKEIEPNIFFCAHDHESKYVKQSQDLTHRSTHTFENRNEILNILFSDNELYEIYVPTCSYRMGTNKIGFGAAVIENNYQKIRYAVFWSPPRFPHLILYLGILIFVLIYCLIFCTPGLFLKQPRTSRHSNSNYDKAALLERI
ncbi:hypothetical protein ACJJTC_003532 [Scirpophaga incertulas]